MVRDCMLPPKIIKKTSTSVLTTSVQHCTGALAMETQRKRNKSSRL